MPPASSPARPGLAARWATGVKDVSYKVRPVTRILSSAHTVVGAVTALPASQFVTETLHSIGAGDGFASWTGMAAGACAVAAGVGSSAASAMKDSGGLRAMIRGGHEVRSNENRLGGERQAGYDRVAANGSYASQYNDGIQSYRGGFSLNPDWSDARKAGFNKALEKEANSEPDEFQAWCDGANTADPATPANEHSEGLSAAPWMTSMTAAPNAPPNDAEAGEPAEPEEPEEPGQPSKALSETSPGSSEAAGASGAPASEVDAATAGRNAAEGESHGAEADQDVDNAVLETAEVRPGTEEPTQDLPESAPEGADSEADAEPSPAESGSESGADVEAESGADVEAGAEAESGADVEAEAEADVEAEAGTDVEAEPGADADDEADVQQDGGDATTTPNVATGPDAGGERPGTAESGAQPEPEQAASESAAAEPGDASSPDPQAPPEPEHEEEDADMDADW